MNIDTKDVQNLASALYSSEKTQDYYSFTPASASDINTIRDILKKYGINPKIHYHLQHTPNVIVPLTADINTRMPNWDTLVKLLEEEIRKTGSEPPACVRYPSAKEIEPLVQMLASPIFTAKSPATINGEDTFFYFVPQTEKNIDALESFLQSKSLPTQRHKSSLYKHTPIIRVAVGAASDYALSIFHNANAAMLNRDTQSLENMMHKVLYSVGPADVFNTTKFLYYIPADRHNIDRAVDLLKKYNIHTEQSILATYDGPVQQAVMIPMYASDMQPNTYLYIIEQKLFKAFNARPVQKAPQIPQAQPQTPSSEIIRKKSLWDQMKALFANKTKGESKR